MIQVLLMDDDPQFRQEIRAVLEQSEDCIVIGEYRGPILSAVHRTIEAIEVASASIARFLGNQRVKQSDPVKAQRNSKPKD